MSATISPVTIRVLGPDDDHGAIGRMVQAGYFGLPDYPPEAWYDQELARVTARGEGSVVVVAELGERVVGCLTYAAEHTMDDAEHDDPAAATFRFFAVDPGAQGHGVGRSMVQWVFARARADGKHRVRIHTLEIMRGARRLYERFGFVRDPDRDKVWEGVVGLAYVAEVPVP